MPVVDEEPYGDATELPRTCGTRRFDTTFFLFENVYKKAERDLNARLTHHFFGQPALVIESSRAGFSQARRLRQYRTNLHLPHGHLSIEEYCASAQPRQHQCRPLHEVLGFDRASDLPGWWKKCLLAKKDERGGKLVLKCLLTKNKKSWDNNRSINSYLMECRNRSLEPFSPLAAKRFVHADPSPHAHARQKKKVGGEIPLQASQTV